jgi:hypothetical protein
MRALGGHAVNGKPATAYECFVREGDKFQGPIDLPVAKDAGLPLGIFIADRS